MFASEGQRSLATAAYLETMSATASRVSGPIAHPTMDREAFVARMLNAIARGIVPSVNLEIYQDGTVSQQSLAYMFAVRDAVYGGHRKLVSGSDGA